MKHLALVTWMISMIPKTLMSSMILHIFDPVSFEAEFIEVATIKEAKRILKVRNMMLDVDTIYYNCGYRYCGFIEK